MVAQLWPCLEYDICIIFVYFIFYEGGEEQFYMYSSSNIIMAKGEGGKVIKIDCLFYQTESGEGD